MWRKVVEEIEKGTKDIGLAKYVKNIEERENVKEKERQKKEEKERDEEREEKTRVIVIGDSMMRGINDALKTKGEIWSTVSYCPGSGIKKNM